MDSRMEKYTTDDTISSRSEKNKKLYDDVAALNIDYIDINVNNAVEIPLDNNYSSTNRTNYQRLKELDSIVAKNVSEEVEEIPIKKERIYDIEEILKRAKEEKTIEEKNKLINTEYNILTKLNIEEIENRDLNKDDLKEIVEKVYPKKEIEENNKDLFSDMIDHDKIDDTNFNDERTTKEFLIKTQIIQKNEQEDKEYNEVVQLDQEPEDNVLEEEKEKKEEEKDFYTEEVEKDTEGKGLTVFIVILVIIIVLIISYFVLKYFGTL